MDALLTEPWPLNEFQILRGGDGHKNVPVLGCSQRPWRCGGDPGQAPGSEVERPRSGKDAEREWGVMSQRNVAKSLTLLKVTEAQNAGILGQVPQFSQAEPVLHQ